MKSYILNYVVFIAFLLNHSSAASHGTYAFHTAPFHDLEGRYSDRKEKSTDIPVESVFQRHPYRRVGHMAMSSRDEELERLQRENELLKRELESTKGKPGKAEDKGFNPLKALGEQVVSCVLRLIEVAAAFQRLSPRMARFSRAIIRSVVLLCLPSSVRVHGNIHYSSDSRFLQLHS